MHTVKSPNEFYEKHSDGTETQLTDLPFDIPTSWTWCRLGEIVQYGECNTIESTSIQEGMWILDLEDIEKATGKITRKRTLIEIQSGSTKHIFKKGNVLYSKLRPYLNKVVIANADGYCSSEILPLDFGKFILSEYAQIFLMSPWFVDYASSCSYGTKMPRLGSKDGRNAFFCLPPYSEQKRIVLKFNELLTEVFNEIQ